MRAVAGSGVRVRGAHSGGHGRGAARLHVHEVLVGRQHLLLAVRDLVLRLLDTRVYHERRRHLWAERGNTVKEDQQSFTKGVLCG